MFEYKLVLLHLTAYTIDSTKAPISIHTTDAPLATKHPSQSSVVPT